MPEAKDTGAKYRNHVISSGPYMFDKVEPGKLYTLKRNPNWDQSTDQVRKALPDGFEVNLNVEGNDLDNRIKDGSLHVDIAGTGVQAAAQSQILSNPELKKRGDNPTIPRLQYLSVTSTVKPFDNLDCRKALFYAIDQSGIQTAYGGPVAGGDLATTVMPPMIPGYQKFDLYPNGPDHKGDLTKAKEHLTKCGKPTGFNIGMIYRADRAKEKATAESVQQSVKRVGINLNLKGVPAGDYFKLYAGLPSYMVKNNIGIATNSWGADWNDGFGYISQIVDGRTIRETGGASNVSVRVPEVSTMLDTAVAELDDAKREAAWGEIDKKTMESAMLYPSLYGKILMLRGEGLTNVFYSDAWNMYDYTALGLE